jgi:hypothetical protein
VASQSIALAALVESVDYQEVQVKNSLCQSRCASYTHQKKPGKSVPLIDLEPAEILPSVVAGMKGNGSTSQQEVLQNKAGSQHLQFHLPSRQFGTAFIQSLGHIAPGQSSVQLLTPLSRNTCVSASSFSHLIEHPVTLYGSLLHSDRYLIAMF